MSSIRTSTVLAAAALLAACSSAPIEPTAAPAQSAVAKPAAPSVAPNAGATTAGTPAASGGSASALPPAAAALAALTPRQRSVYFDFDDFTIDPADQRMLAQHAKVLVAEPGVNVRLEGHADDRGSAEYNLALGQRRAEAVKRALAILGVRESQMQATSWGEEKPAVAGENEYAWSRNRRAEIVYPQK